MEQRYDVLVIGGAFSGAATALLLLRLRPGTRVLVLERAERFDKKVGEATVEVSGFFLAHVLRLHRVLSEQHLPKHGLRYFFTDGQQRRLEEMSEVGGISVPALPSFQLDRELLDERLLAMAAEEGADVRRPARVLEVELGWPESRISFEQGGERRTASARWVVDASGKQAFLARRMGLLVKNEAHPTAALWGRWKGVLDLDGARALGADPRAQRLGRIQASRRLATVHFCGRGWWCWVIPLSGGETSIGLVHDKRFAELPPGDNPRARYLAFLRAQDGLRELVAGAELDAHDFRSYDQLAYRSTRYMDRGWALVGDAAAFIDPYYSPGLDHASMSAFATARLIQEDLEGRLEGAALERAVALHDERFQRSQERWFDALYRDKYELFGDAELTAAAFYLDTAMYYLGVVHPVYARIEELRMPLLGSEGWQAALAYRLLRFQSRRLLRLARRRLARGTYGRRNVGWTDMVQNFGSASLTLTKAHRHGLALWLRAELRDVLETLLPRRARAAAPAHGAAHDAERGIEHGAERGAERGAVRGAERRAEHGAENGAIRPLPEPSARRGEA